MVVSALQEKIDKLKNEIEAKKKEIISHQVLIKEYSGDEVESILENSKPIKEKGVRDGGWIAKIQSVLNNSDT